jgi:glycosyl-4,4'-diaponeurosporenoate acyltransferase
MPGPRGRVTTLRLDSATFAAKHPGARRTEKQDGDYYGDAVLTSLSLEKAVAVDSGVWFIWSILVGCWASHLRPGRIDADGWLTRMRPWERDGKIYDRVRVRRWKRWLPDAGVLGGGRPKRLTRWRDAEEWQTLAAETRRAERVHWLLPLAFFATALVRGGPILVAMGAYAIISNAPCIVAQRHNRGRLKVLLQRRAVATARR